MKVKTYDFRTFMKGEHLDYVKPPTLSLIPLTVAPFIPITASAQTEAEIQTKMMNAFTPIIQLVQGLAYPMAMIVSLGGALYVMIGNSEKGFSMMQKAGLGYVIVMIMPMFLNVLVEAMKGVA